MLEAARPEISGFSAHAAQDTSPSPDSRGGLSGWLPDPPRPPDAETLRPWEAPTLTRLRADQRGLTYVVVEEILGEVVGLAMYPWPAADSRGRLRFDTAQRPGEAAVSCQELCRVLREHDLAFVPAGKGPTPDRELRVGDVFAVRIEGTALPSSVSPDRWRQVFDISADARDLAKLAYYGAVTEKWEWKHAEDLLLTERADQGN